MLMLVRESYERHPNSPLLFNGSNFQVSLIPIPCILKSKRDLAPFFHISDKAVKITETLLRLFYGRHELN